MKRWLALLLALLVMLSLVGCGSGGDHSSDVIQILPEESDKVELPLIEDDTADEREELPLIEDNDPAAETEEPVVEEPETQTIDENGIYDSKEEVALYLHIYGHLPSNYITKKEAQALGWPGGSLEPYKKNGCIGGTYFGNYEGMLPQKKGRSYTECDIDTMGAKSRGAKRIVFSNDGLIYYTDDHYESFTLLYGEVEK